MTLPQLTQTWTGGTGESTVQETYTWGWSGSPDPALDHYELCFWEVHLSSDRWMPGAAAVTGPHVGWLDLASKTSTSRVIVRGRDLTLGVYLLYVVAVDASGNALAATAGVNMYVGYSNSTTKDLKYPNTPVPVTLTVPVHTYGAGNYLNVWIDGVSMSSGAPFVYGSNLTAAALQASLRTGTGDAGLTVTGTTNTGPFTITFDDGAAHTGTWWASNGASTDMAMAPAPGASDPTTGTWSVAGVQHGTTAYKAWHNSNEAGSGGGFAALPGGFVTDDYGLTAPSAYTFAGGYRPPSVPASFWGAQHAPQEIAWL